MTTDTLLRHCLAEWVMLPWCCRWDSKDLGIHILPPCKYGSTSSEAYTFPTCCHILFIFLCVCVCARTCMLGRFSCVWLFATPWTVVRQVPLSMRILQARTLEWVAMPSSRGSSWPRNRTCVSYVSCISRRVPYHYSHLGGPHSNFYLRWDDLKFIALWLL